MDLGSGGGVPGLPLAARAWPACRWILLDASERRTAFLEAAVVRLHLTDRATVVRARAEDAGRRPDLRAVADLVTARGFGSPSVTAECAAPLLRVGGRLIVSEPPESTGERWPGEPLAQLGLRPLRLLRDGAGYQVLEQQAPCPERFPRRVGVPAKRPLF